jgi:hypothetical protein
VHSFSKAFGRKVLTGDERKISGASRKIAVGRKKIVERW